MTSNGSELREEAAEAASLAGRPASPAATEVGPTPPCPGPISPYGGRLIDRVTDPEESAELREQASELSRLHLDRRTLSDLYLIAVGGLSPLEGFMDAESYASVVDEACLPSGLPWGIPITLPGNGEQGARLEHGARAALVAPDGELAGMLEVTQTYRRVLAREAERVYGTTDDAHPGVAALRAQSTTCVAGPIHYLYRRDISGFPAEHLSPRETRLRFDELGWRTVVAFQTRNPTNRAHEYIQKCALELVDGLLLHPIVGETKDDDVPAAVRMECYRAVLERYFPAERVLLSVLPAAMRYAGPREAIHHAIVRRNYGCTHFIVGRDHAGVGSYYGTDDAQRIFDRLDPEALGIRPLGFEHAFWCRLTGQMGTAKTSPAPPEKRLFFSGTELREMLSRGELPPEEFARPEVAEILMRAYRRAETA